MENDEESPYSTREIQQFLVLLGVNQELTRFLISTKTNHSVCDCISSQAVHTEYLAVNSFYRKAYISSLIYNSDIYEFFSTASLLLRNLTVKISEVPLLREVYLEQKVLPSLHLEFSFCDLPP